jgi:hypothetical protein
MPERAARLDLVALAPAQPGRKVMRREARDGGAIELLRWQEGRLFRGLPLEELQAAAEDATSAGRKPRGTLPRSSPTTTAPARAASSRTTASIASRGIRT